MPKNYSKAYKELDKELKHKEKKQQAAKENADAKAQRRLRKAEAQRQGQTHQPHTPPPHTPPHTPPPHTPLSFHTHLLSSYQILGLTPGATLEMIRRAYRHLARLNHPDKNSSASAEEKMKSINDAYEKLTLALNTPIQ